MRIQIKIWYFLSIVHTSLSTYWKTLQPEIKIKTLGVLFKFEILTTQKSITKTMAKIRLQVWTSYYELNKKYETFFQYFNYVLQYRLFQRVWTWFFQNELYAMKTSYNFFCRYEYERFMNVLSYSAWIFLKFSVHILQLLCNTLYYCKPWNVKNSTHLFFSCAKLYPTNIWH